MFSQFIGHFVRFYTVMESSDPKSILLGEAHEHQDFILPVAMRLYNDIPIQNIAQRIHPKISAGRNSLPVSLPLVPPGFIVSRHTEPVCYDLLDSHACFRITVCSYPFRIFTQCKLHGYRGILYFQDRKSTRLNSSHVAISYAVFCLKKKREENISYTESR